ARLGDLLKVPCIDTGAMYRYVAFQALQKKIDLQDEATLIALTEPMQFSLQGAGGSSRMLIDGQFDLQALPWRTQIRTPEVSMAASTVAKLGGLRRVLVKKQRELAEKEGGILNGRDAGTVICPDSPFKF